MTAPGPNVGLLPVPTLTVLLLSLLTVTADSSSDETSEFIASRLPSAETGSEADHLTGDWGGFRTRLVDRGIHFRAGYIGEVLSNVSGGLRRGTVYEGLLEMSLELQTEPLLGWQGGIFQASSLYPHGRGLSTEYVGDLSTLSNIDAYDSLRLFELWYEQNFWADQFSLRLGQLAADEEFAVSSHSELFLNSNFGWPPFISANAPAPAYPVAAPGARLRYSPTHQLYFQAAAFDGDPGSDNFNDHGTRVRLDDSEGALLMFEAGLHFHAEDHAQRLPGSYKIGGWVHTDSFPHQRLDTTGLSLANPASNGNPQSEHSNWGLYFVLDQMLWRESTDPDQAHQGLNLFARAGGSPADRNLLELYLDAGLTYAGLLPGRDRDLAGLGVSYERIGSQARGFSRDLNTFGVTNTDERDYEIALEATYQISVSPWFTVQPDLQWIIHPGGSGAIPNALVLGLRSSVIF